MKQMLSFFTVAAIMTACNSNPKNGNDSFVVSPAVEKPAVTAPASDTAGLANYQAWKAQHELAKPEDYKKETATASTRKVERAYAPVHKSVRSETTTTTGTNSTATQNGNMNSETSNTAMRKKGWSSAAKDAAIGAGTGAVIGAVISKNNRASGAVIGGAIGAGAGYGLGRSKDKKDGRY